MTELAGGAGRAVKRLLVVTVTKGYRHESIGTAEKVLADLAEKTGAFTLDHAGTDDDLALKMTPEGLKQYDGVFFANTTGDLPIPDKQAFIDWVHAGHGFIGAHSASDTYHNFPAYLDMLGGEFKMHGNQVPVTVLVADSRFPGTEHLGKTIDIPMEEIYIIQKFLGDQVRLLLYLDKHPNDHTPGLYPMSWARKFGKGRVFYTALGHRDEVWNAPWFGEHLLGGVRWALGLAKGDVHPKPLPTV